MMNLIAIPAGPFLPAFNAGFDAQFGQYLQ